MSWFAALPKVELHVHLEGAIPHPALFELVRKYGGDPAVPDVSTLAERFVYRDFPHFIETWIWKNQFLREAEDFAFISERVARDLARQNIRYAEMFFSPSPFARRGLAVRDLARAVRRGLSRVPHIEIALVADLVRDNGPESELETLRSLADVRDCGVIGVGLGGSEQAFPPEPFAPLFREARALGFRTTAHAGEAVGPESVRGALRALEAERIGHATRAVEDPTLLDLLAEHRVPLECCPVSNVRTGAVASIEAHPLRRYFERGLLVSVNTDDPAMFGTSLADEYRLLVDRCGFTREDIQALILNGIDSSWLPPARKSRLADEFIADPAWSGIPT
jgi:adenosine deaminase